VPVWNLNTRDIYPLPALFSRGGGGEEEEEEGKK